jgi:putative nucleotidyltransferase with HDIG domain
MSEDKFYSQISNLPASVDVVVRLMFMLRNPNVDNSDFVEVLITDKTLSNLLLKKVDLPTDNDGKPEPGEFVYKAPQSNIKLTPEEIQQQEEEEKQRITEELEMAVMRLGHGEILKMVSGISFGKILGSELRGYNIAKNELWVHSVIVGLLSQFIAKMMTDLGGPKVDQTNAFIAGLLHDIGKAGLSSDLSAKLSQAKEKLSTKSLTWVEIEKDLCGTDHASYGAILAKKWNLADDVCSAIQLHHQPPEGQLLPSVVHLADSAARLMGSAPGLGGFSLRTDPRALQTCNLRLDNIEQVVQRITLDQEMVKNYCATN